MEAYKKIDRGFSLFIGRDSLKNPVKRVKSHKIFHADDSDELRSMRVREREREILRNEFELDNSYARDLDRDLYFYKKMLKNRFYHHEAYLTGSNENAPNWFEEGLEKVNVRFIETQRIITAKESGSDSYINNLGKCSNELKKMIDIASKKSSQVASVLDSTYPNRLVKKLRQGTRDTFEELNTALAKLDERRSVFSEAGLAVKISDYDLLQIDERQKDLVNVLKLYIDDSHKKLDPYADLLQKIKLFKSIINKRFKHKSLEINRDEGFSFRSSVVRDSDGKFEIIPPSKLSSGEQHELILFYKLIFSSQENDLILIDEPELSLHISWQNKFIRDLKEVTSINDVSIVIATHSPDIIDENWDLRVELLGVE